MIIFGISGCCWLSEYEQYGYGLKPLKAAGQTMLVNAYFTQAEGVSGGSGTTLITLYKVDGHFQ